MKLKYLNTVFFLILFSTSNYSTPEVTWSKSIKIVEPEIISYLNKHTMAEQGVPYISDLNIEASSHPYPKRLGKDSLYEITLPSLLVYLSWLLLSYGVPPGPFTP